MRNKNLLKNKENKKSLNLAETVLAEFFNSICMYINLLIFNSKLCRATVAQPGRASASRADVLADVRVQKLNQDGSPGSGALNSLSFVIILSIFLLLSTLALAIPNSLTIQGKLTNLAGASQSGTFNFTFRIYDAPTEGNVLYELANYNISVDSNGVYDVVLPGINVSFADQLYLGITVKTDNESTPRVNLTAAPYSFRANTSEALNPNGTYFVTNLSVLGNATIGNGNTTLEISTISFNVSKSGSLSLAGNLSVNGSTFFVNSLNGSVGIGAMPAQYLLQTGLGTDGRSVNLSNAFFINGTSGRIGINTTNPTHLLTVVGSVNVTGDVFLGVSTTNTLSVTSNIASHLIPNDNTRDLGSASNFWRRAYIDQATITNLSVSGNTTVGGTTSPTFTLNSNYSGNDVQDVELIFERGTPTTNAVLKWDSTNKAFNMNLPLTIDANMNLTVDTNTLYVNGLTDRIGIGTLTPTETLTVIGNVNVSGYVNISGNLIVNNKFNVTASSGNVNVEGTINAGGVISSQGQALQQEVSAFKRANVSDYLGGADVNASLIKTGNLSVVFSDKNTSLWNRTGENIYQKELSGNVSIGTTSPSGKLTITGGDGNQPELNISGSSADVIVVLLNTGADGNQWQLASLGTVTNRNGNFEIQNMDDAVNQPKLVIQPGGNVGIGTNIPGRTLEVAGSINGTQLNISGPANLAYGSGSVGVGTATPNDILEVVGNIRVSGSLNASFINATQIRIGTDIVQEEPDAFKRANVTEFIGSDVGNASILRVGNISNIVKDQWIRANTSDYLGGSDVNASLIKVGNLSTILSGSNTSLWNRTGANTILKFNSDNVGIGTGVPDNRLTIAGSDVDANLAGQPGLLHLNITDSYNRSVTNLITLDHYLNNPVNASGDLGVSILFRATDNASQLEKLGNISVFLYNTTNGSELSAMTFSTRGPETNTEVRGQLLERLRIDGSGRVGIGTTTPTQKLVVRGGVDSDGLNSIIQIDTNGTNNGILRFSNNTAAKYDLVYSSASNIFQINAPSADNALVIDRSGNVGIGLTQPNNTLVVAGTLNVTGNTVVDSADSTFFVDTSNNRVGIGTTAPVDNLHVFGGNITYTTNSAGSGSVGGIRFFPSTATNAYGAFVYTERTSPDGASLLFGTTDALGPSTPPVERMRVTRDGRVGINTTSPSGTFHVTNANVDFIVTAGGRVGIGTTAPATVLDVKGKANFTGNFTIGQTGNIFFVDNTSGNVGIGTSSPGTYLTGDPNALVIATNLGVSNRAALVLVGNRGATDNSEVIGRIRFANNVSGNPQSVNAEIVAVMDASADVDSANLAFHTHDTTAGGSPPERMRITSAGKVGVNTSTPAQTLQVAGTLNVTTQPTRGGDFFIDTNGSVGINTSTPQFTMHIRHIDNGSFNQNAGALFIGGTDNYKEGGLKIGYYGTNFSWLQSGISTVLTNPLLLQPVGGNVGINTYSPTESLVVAGNANITGTLYKGTSVYNNPDIAEKIPSKQLLEEGDLVIVDEENDNHVKKSTKQYDEVIGVVSPNASLVIGNWRGGFSGYNIALLGRVAIKISLENGPIKRGDALAASSIEGTAMKATQGRIIGYALEDYDESKKPIELEGAKSEQFKAQGLRDDGINKIKEKLKHLIENETISISEAKSSNLITGKAISELEDENETDEEIKDELIENFVEQINKTDDASEIIGNLDIDKKHEDELLEIVKKKKELEEEAKKVEENVTPKILMVLSPGWYGSSDAQANSIYQNNIFYSGINSIKFNITESINETSEINITTEINETFEINGTNQTVTTYNVTTIANTTTKDITKEIEKSVPNDFIFRAGDASSSNDLMIINATTGEVKVKKLKADIIEADNIAAAQQTQTLSRIQEVNGSVIIRLG